MTERKFEKTENSPLYRLIFDAWVDQYELYVMDEFIAEVAALRNPLGEDL